METPQISLTIHIVDGDFRAITAADQNGAPYEVIMSFVRQRDVEISEEDKAKPPAPGANCCSDDDLLCKYVAAAPPCPAGYHETRVEIKHYETAAETA